LVVWGAIRRKGGSLGAKIYLSLFNIITFFIIKGGRAS